MLDLSQEYASIFFTISMLLTRIVISSIIEDNYLQYVNCKNSLIRMVPKVQSDGGLLDFWFLITFILMLFATVIWLESNKVFQFELTRYGLGFSLGGIIDFTYAKRA